MTRTLVDAAALISILLAFLAVIWHQLSSISLARTPEDTRAAFTSETILSPEAQNFGSRHRSILALVE